MPTYAYACTACDHSFDVQQSFSDDALTECPECAGRLRKLFSSVGVVFKGSGFYRTDSRSDSKGSVAAASPTAKESKDAGGASASSSSGTGTSSGGSGGGGTGTSSSTSGSGSSSSSSSSAPAAASASA